MRMLAMPGADGTVQRRKRAAGRTLHRGLSAPGEEESASVPITAGGQDITDLVITTGPGVNDLRAGDVRRRGQPARNRARHRELSRSGGPAAHAHLRQQARGRSTRRVDSRSEVYPAARCSTSSPSRLDGSAGLVSQVGHAQRREHHRHATRYRDGRRTARTIEIVMTDKQTTLSGTVRNARGEQVVDYTVVVFPDRLREGAIPGAVHTPCDPISRDASKRAACRPATISRRRSSHSNRAATGIRRFGSTSSRRRGASD